MLFYLTGSDFNIAGEGILKVESADPQASIVFGVSDVQITILTCPENAERLKNLALFECSCNRGFYLEQSFGSPICFGCSVGCEACTGPLQCLECKEGYQKEGSLCRKIGNKI